MLKLLIYSNYTSSSLILEDNIDIQNIENNESIVSLFNEFTQNVYPYEILRSYIWDMDNHRVIVDRIENILNKI